MSVESPMWELGLLDGLRLRRDGVEVAEFQARKQDELLAYLGVFPRARQPRTRLVELLWPEKPPRLARNRLCEVLCLLNRELEVLAPAADLILADRYFIWLNPKVTTDIQQFEDRFAQTLRMTDAGARVDALEAMLRRFGAGMLPAIAREWVAPERRRLETVYQHAARALIEALGSSGQFSEVVAMTAELTPAEAVRYFLLAGAPGSPALFEQGLPAMPRLAAAAIGPVTIDTGPAPVRFDDIDAAPPALDPPRRLADHCLSLVKEAESHFSGPERREWLARIDGVYDAIQSVLDWAADTEAHGLGIGLTGGLWRYWQARSRVDEGRRYLERFLAMRSRGESADDAKALNGAGALALQAGDLDLAATRLRRALELWRRLNDVSGVARALLNLGIVSYKAGDYPSARRELAESQGIARALGEQGLLAIVLGNLALVDIAEGNFEAAEAALGEKLEIARASNDACKTASAMVSLSTIAQHRADTAAARRYVEQALDYYGVLSDFRGVAFCLRSQGYIASVEGRIEDARRFFDESLGLCRWLGDGRGSGESLRYLAALAESTGDPGGARALYRQARALLAGAGDTAGVQKTDMALSELVCTTP